MGIEVLAETPTRSFDSRPRKLVAAYVTGRLHAKQSVFEFRAQFRNAGNFPLLQDSRHIDLENPNPSLAWYGEKPGMALLSNAEGPNIQF